MGTQKASGHNTEFSGLMGQTIMVKTWLNLIFTHKTEYIRIRLYHNIRFIRSYRTIVALMCWPKSESVWLNLNQTIKANN
jgi:hypothetical protein